MRAQRPSEAEVRMAMRQEDARLLREALGKSIGAEPVSCVGCGCTEENACPGGCSWVAVDYESGVGICSRCAAKSLEQLIAEGGLL